VCNNIGFNLCPENSIPDDCILVVWSNRIIIPCKMEQKNKTTVVKQIIPLFKALYGCIRIWLYPKEKEFREISLWKRTKICRSVIRCKEKTK